MYRGLTLFRISISLYIAVPCRLMPPTSTLGSQWAPVFLPFYRGADQAREGKLRDHQRHFRCLKGWLPARTQCPTAPKMTKPIEFQSSCVTPDVSDPSWAAGVSASRRSPGPAVWMSVQTLLLCIGGGMAGTPLQAREGTRGAGLLLPRWGDAEEEKPERRVRPEGGHSPGKRCWSLMRK
jgi:hypothetical protein